MATATMHPETCIVGTSRAWLVLMTMFTVATVALGLTLLVPNASYVRYQQSAHTILFHAKWIYERIHFDPTPIDVALIGTSRVEAGFSPIILSQSLSLPGQEPTHVANLALRQSGRDLQYVIAKLLIEAHHEVKILVLGLEEDVAASHPLFKYVGTVDDVIGSPIFFNESYFENLLFLPYRQMTYGVESAFPGIFGIQPKFDRADYLGTDLDRTTGYRQESPPALINGDQTEPADMQREAVQQAELAHAQTMRYISRLEPDERLAVERYFVTRIKTLCDTHGIKLVFASLPEFEARPMPEDRSFYAKMAPILEIGGFETNPEFFSDGIHLNRSGAIVASRQLATDIIGYLPSPP